MASDVDICNMALALLGDAATLASIDPPEGSAQASHCARFYPIARDALLEMSDWSFTTLRVQLAPVTNSFPMWAYAYQAPSDMLTPIAVLANDAADDYSEPYVQDVGYCREIPMGSARYAPQPFALETDPTLGVQVILTNQEAAVLRYTRTSSDPTLFSPLFVTVLSYWLASYLAGPIIKGDAGMKVAQMMRQSAMDLLPKATASDANQQMIRPTHSVPWLANR